MPFGFDDAALLVGLGSQLFNAFRDDSPNIDFSKYEDDINRRINADLASAQARASGDIRSRLASQGLGGSGVIDRAIRDEQARIRRIFEERRQNALAELEKYKLGIDLQSQQNQSAKQFDFFNSLGNLGTNYYAFKNPELFNPLIGQFNELNRSLENRSYFNNFDQNLLKPSDDASRTGYNPNIQVG